MTGARRRLRSAEWFDGHDEAGLLHRVALRSGRVGAGALEARPVVAVTRSETTLNPCNAAMRGRVDAILEGIEEAGGVAVELPTMSLGEDLMKPTAMLYRNLLSMEVEEYLRAYPIDGVVVTGICDKSLPGGLMGALSADLPTIVHAGGARPAACLAGRELGTTDVWRITHDRAAGRVTDDEWSGLEDALAAGRGGCNVMGTASTMAVLVEALGLVLPGTSVIPADDPGGVEAAHETGRRSVALALEGIRPSDLLTRGSFRNAVCALAAIGGSTNAVVHLLALAGRAGIGLGLEDIRSAAQETPVVVDVEPVGARLVQALHRDGGFPAVARVIADRLDLSARSVGGLLLADIVASAPWPSGCLRTALDPVADAPAIEVLYGSLAPGGTVLKQATASPRLLQHTGRALVFDDYHDMRTRIADPDLPVTADTVLVMRGCGPVGAPGMPEWGMIPIPPKLTAEGVTDLVRITDARMSGTSYGTVLLHATPESAVGGPLALVRDGDPIRLDLAHRRLDLLVDEAELAARAPVAPVTDGVFERGWPRLYRDHVLQADHGCDFDFLTLPISSRPRLVPPVVGRS